MMMDPINNENSFAPKGSFIYNVTIKVEGGIADTWLQWMLQTHIPEVMATRCFTQFRVVRLLDVDDAEGPTYAIQYNAQSRADYNRYIEIHAPGMRQKTYDAWGEKFIAFRSIMEVVQ